MRIASIHAHPDDAEILAGGTLALLAKLDHEILIITLSAGDCGSMTLGADEIATIRQAEAADSAALIGATYRWGGFRDMSIFSDDASRRRMTGLLREIRPDVVLTAAPSDYLCDHEATSQLVRDACFAAPIPNYTVQTQSPPLAAIPHLYFMNPIASWDAAQHRSGTGLAPDFTVDVASAMDTKRAMLGKHKSQRQWLQQQHGIDDYIREMEEWTHGCGARVGIEWGEGFRHYKVHPFPGKAVLEMLLPGHLVIPKRVADHAPARKNEFA